MRHCLLSVPVILTRSQERASPSPATSSHVFLVLWARGGSGRGSGPPLAVLWAPQIWVSSPHNATGYYTVYGEEALHADHFSARLSFGDTQTVWARTGYLGFLRRTELTDASGGEAWPQRSHGGAPVRRRPGSPGSRGCPSEAHGPCSQSDTMRCTWSGLWTRRWS